MASLQVCCTAKVYLKHFFSGQQVYVPERQARGVLLKVEPGVPQCDIKVHIKNKDHEQSIDY